MKEVMSEITKAEKALNQMKAKKMDAEVIAAQEKLSDGYRVVSNCGPHACQSVPHLHFHILGGTQMGEKMA